MSRENKFKRAFKLAASVVTGKPVQSYKLYGGTIELHWETAGEHRRAVHDPWTLRDYIDAGEKRGEDMSFEREALQAYRDWEEEGQRNHAKWKEDQANKRANRVKVVARNKRYTGGLYARP